MNSVNLFIGSYWTCVRHLMLDLVLYEMKQ